MSGLPGRFADLKWCRTGMGQVDQLFKTELEGENWLDLTSGVGSLCFSLCVFSELIDEFLIMNPKNGKNFWGWVSGTDRGATICMKKHRNFKSQA